MRSIAAWSLELGRIGTVGDAFPEPQVCELPWSSPKVVVEP